MAPSDPKKHFPSWPTPGVLVPKVNITHRLSNVRVHISGVTKFLTLSKTPHCDSDKKLCGTRNMDPKTRSYRKLRLCWFAIKLILKMKKIFSKHWPTKFFVAATGQIEQMLVKNYHLDTTLLTTFRSHRKAGLTLASLLSSQGVQLLVEVPFVIYEWLV